MSDDLYYADDPEFITKILPLNHADRLKIFIILVSVTRQIYSIVPFMNNFQTIKLRNYSIDIAWSSDSI